MRDPLQTLATSIHDIPCAAFLCNQAGQIVAFNQRTAAVWECSIETVTVSKDFGQYLGPIASLDTHGQTVAPSETFVAQAIDSGTEFVGPVVLRTRSGKVINRIAQVRPLQDASRATVGAICLLTETETCNNEALLMSQLVTFLASVTNTAAEGFCVFQLTGAPAGIQFTVWSDRMMEITGFSQEEINLLKWDTALYPDPNLRLAATSRAQSMLSGHHLKCEEWAITRKQGDRRVLSISTSQIEAAVFPSTYVGFVEDITDRRRAEETLRYMIQSVTSMTGEEYFNKLVTFLCETCQVRFVLVAELESQCYGRAKTIAVADQSTLLENFSYDLAGTPCETMWDLQSIFCISDDAKLQYPYDSFLQLYEIRGYLGIPLWAQSGEPIGMLILLSPDPLVDPERAKSLLQVVGARSAAELERRRVENALRRSEQHLQSIANTLPQALYLFDIDNQTTEFQNYLVARSLGYSADEMNNHGGDMVAHLYWFSGSCENEVSV